MLTTGVRGMTAFFGNNINDLTLGCDQFQEFLFRQRL